MPSILERQREVKVKTRYLNKRSIATLLGGVYLGALVVAALVILLTHTSSPPKYNVLRFPRYLGDVEPKGGTANDWLFQLYHLLLLGFVSTSLLNAVNLRNLAEASSRKVMQVSSLVGGLGSVLTIGFFVFALARLGIDQPRTDLGTIALYTVLAAIVLIANVGTFALAVHAHAEAIASSTA